MHILRGIRMMMVRLITRATRHYELRATCFPRGGVPTQLASVEARKHPGEDWSKGPATLREKQPAVVESADSTMNDQTSTLYIAIEENCGEAKDSPVVERGASKEGQSTYLLFLLEKQQRI
ncbi:hypothetical protein CK203_088634 [Vitis vinifera]|uniref:Uncharacterized protein n=1 Tax=Vitis vinifera TaxID=29760 RepID=A0A438C100_VITVI|nr:hypothetical protein CK203_088634 [Vitis vinifera]